MSISEEGSSFGRHFWRWSLDGGNSQGRVLGWNFPPKHSRLFGYVNVNSCGDNFNQTGTTNVSMNSRIQEMKERISSSEDTIEEIDSSDKKN